MGAATLSDALRAVIAVLLVERFQPHRHGSLDTLSLARGLAERTRPPIFLRNPATVHGRCLRASASQTLVPVVPVVVEGFGVLRCRDPIDACGARLARVAGRLPQHILVAQVSPRPKHAIGIAG